MAEENATANSAKYRQGIREQVAGEGGVGAISPVPFCGLRIVQFFDKEANVVTG